jgi:hypothetical protein
MDRGARWRRRWTAEQGAPPTKLGFTPPSALPFALAGGSRSVSPLRVRLCERPRAARPWPVVGLGRWKVAAGPSLALALWLISVKTAVFWFKTEKPRVHMVSVSVNCNLNRKLKKPIFQVQLGFFGFDFRFWLGYTLSEVSPTAPTAGGMARYA